MGESVIKVFVVIVWLAVSLYASLPMGIERAIIGAGVPLKDVSLYIKEAGRGGEVVASLNADTVRTPASVIKVLSTYAAVLSLGFDYRWPTQFYRHGVVKRGTLYGDLIVKGFGDPTLSAEDLPSIVASLKRKGIHTINGNIVIDRSYFQVGTENSSHFDENPYSPYNAMPDALMFNERVSTICVTPNRNSVTKKYPDESYRLHNDLVRVNKPCKGRYSWPRIKIDESKAVPEVWVKGKISKRCGKREICRVVTKPYKAFYYAFKSALQEGGIDFHGDLKLRRVPKDAHILFTHYSQPLEKIVAKTAKKSNNLYARHLLLYLGAKRFGAPATLQKGRRAVMQILQSHGALKAHQLKIDNGSGLSRTARLTTFVLADMLDDAYARYGKRWMRTLSIAGVDGTIRKRFRGTKVSHRAWMKTGTLKRVKNIAGYVKSKEGEIYTVVILVNTKRGRWRASKLQNEILKWLVDYRKTQLRPASDIVDQMIRNENSGGDDTPALKTTTQVQYYIQAGAFAQPPNKVYLSKIQAEGLPYRIYHTTEYKVLIGPFSSESKARAVLMQVRNRLGEGAFLTKEP